MLKWTTRGILADTDNPSFSSGDRFSSNKSSDLLRQEANRAHLPQNVIFDPGLNPSYSLPIPRSYKRKFSPTSAPNSPPPQRRRSGSVGSSKGFSYVQSLSLPSSPVKSSTASLDERGQKKTGVLAKFKNLFRRSSSARKGMTGQSSSSKISLESYSPGRTSKRSRSPDKKENPGDIKGSLGSKTRLTKLIEAKREQRKSTRANLGLPGLPSTPRKSPSSTSTEDHKYVQHGSVDKFLVLQAPSTYISASSDKDIPTFSARTFRDNNEQGEAHGLQRNTIFAGADIPRRHGYGSHLWRSSSLRSSIDRSEPHFQNTGHSLGPDDSFQTANRRWSSQSTNTSLRSNYDLQNCPAAHDKRLPQMISRALTGSSKNSKDSLLEYGESLMAMIESGSSKGVKVMPSRPDKIIQARESLSPVDSGAPTTVKDSRSSQLALATGEAVDKYIWSLADDGGLFITLAHDNSVSQTKTGALDHTSSSLPKINNNGHGTVHERSSIPQILPEKSDLFPGDRRIQREHLMEDKNYRNLKDHDGDFHGNIGAESDTICVAESYERIPSRTFSDGDQMDGVVMSRRRVKDMIKSIENQYEPVVRRISSDHGERVLSYREIIITARESDLYRQSHDDCGSNEATEVNSSKIPAGLRACAEGILIQEPTLSPLPRLSTPNASSSFESGGFSPKFFSGSSDVKSPFVDNKHLREQDSSDSQCYTEDEDNDSINEVGTFSGSSPQPSNLSSIPTELEDDTYTFKLAEQGILSESSDIESLVFNIELAESKATGQKMKSSTEFQNDLQAFPGRSCGQINGAVTESRGCSDQRNEEGTECRHSDEPNDAVTEDKEQKLQEPEQAAIVHEVPKDVKEFQVSFKNEVTFHSAVVSREFNLISINDTEEGITDVKAPTSMVSQDSSVLEEIQDGCMDLCEDKLVCEVCNWVPSADNKPTSGADNNSILQVLIVHKKQNKEEPLTLTVSKESPDVLLHPLTLLREDGSSCGEVQHTLNVKPKKKVSFKLDMPVVDDLSSFSDVAVIELTPVAMASTSVAIKESVPFVKAAVGCDQKVEDQAELADSASATDVSSSFSLKSNEGPQVASTGEDISWWEAEKVEDIKFFHDLTTQVSGTEVKNIIAPSISAVERQTNQHDSAKILTLSSFLFGNFDLSLDPSAVCFNTLPTSASDAVWFRQGQVVYEPLRSIDIFNIERIEEITSIVDERVNLLEKESNADTGESTQEHQDTETQASPLIGDELNIHNQMDRAEMENKRIVSQSDTNSQTYDVSNPVTPAKERVPWWQKSAVALDNEQDVEDAETDLEGSNTLSNIANQLQNSSSADCTTDNDTADVCSGTKQHNKKTADVNNKKHRKTAQKASNILHHRNLHTGSSKYRNNKQNTDLQQRQTSAQSSDEEVQNNERKQSQKLRSGKKKENFAIRRKLFLLQKLRQEKKSSPLKVTKPNNKNKKLLDTFKKQNSGNNQADRQKKDDCYRSYKTETESGSETYTYSFVDDTKVSCNQVISRSVNTARSHAHVKIKIKSPLSPMTKCGSGLVPADDQSGSGDCLESIEDQSFHTLEDLVTTGSVICAPTECGDPDLHESVTTFPSLNKGGLKGSCSDLYDIVKQDCKVTRETSFQGNEQKSSSHVSNHDLSEDDSNGIGTASNAAHKRRRRPVAGHSCHFKTRSSGNPYCDSCEAFYMSESNREVHQGERISGNPRHCSGCSHQTCRGQRPQNGSQTQNGGFLGAEISEAAQSKQDNQPGQWLFIATFFIFQLFLHWLYSR